ncbi:MAG TPA: hypothetical protein VNA14_06385, partial [Mycobacteriales bacterium]|nr:hypothetical protein [Mycobacteriales bacterium]
MTDDLLARTAFAAHGPLHRLLARLRGRAVAAPVPPGGDRDAGRPFLSVLTRTQGRRPETLRELLLCLAAQTSDDFELL